MIDRDDLKCPNCGSFQLKQEKQYQVNGKDTERKDRENNGLKIDILQDILQQLYCHPVDKTWYGCIMCNTEFDETGKIYKIKKMYPFNLKEFRRLLGEWDNGDGSSFRC